MIVFLPLSGVQSAISREVAILRAHAADEEITALIRKVARVAGLVAGAAALVVAASAPLLEPLLGLSSPWSVAATALLLGAGSLMTVFQGFLLGLGRFKSMGISLLWYGGLRVAVVMPLLLAGLGVAGAVGASAVAAFVALLVVFRALADYRGSPTARAVRAARVENFMLVVAGLFAFTLLTNLDVLVAKAYLPPAEAGQYASAALVGKLAAFVPAAAISPVLLPRATERIRRGEDATDALRKSLIAAVCFGLVLTGVCLAVPESFVTWAFGPEFGDAVGLLAPSAAAMTICGALNVHLAFALASGDRIFVWLLGAAAALQAALFTVLHSSGYQIIAAIALSALSALIINEVRSPVAGWRLWLPSRSLR